MEGILGSPPHSSFGILRRAGEKQAGSFLPGRKRQTITSQPSVEKANVSSVRLEHLFCRILLSYFLPPRLELSASLLDLAGQ